MDIEDVFCSRLRLKILKILAKVGELNVSEIAHRLKVNYAVASKHLKVLEDEGILLHKTFGRIRLYRVNEHSARAKAVQDFMEAWEQTSKK